ncbi:MAG: 50S ribosomal protein L1 [Proteobacteria bacterium]|jgi:large subunit ribosomal protein L1|nr:50S ribosomal protein L1 [Alphaproteobacteria bacterium]NCC02426.1 50S ribosomal protein L1 [Pseudomonadota bacterium]
MAKAKKIRKALEAVDRNKMYPLEEGVALIKKVATDTARKFAETLEVSVALGIDPRQSDQAVRGMVQLPHGTGKTVRVLVFAKGEKADAAMAAGADHVGAEELGEKIVAGFSDFDRVIATPDMMVVVGKLGKILGPRGLMPNPKLGTVTPNVAEAVKAAKAGSIEFRAEKAGIIHAGVGKVTFTEKQLVENARALISALQKARPSGVKGTYINAVHLSSTMGPGIKVDLSTLSESA